MNIRLACQGIKLPIPAFTVAPSPAFGSHLLRKSLIVGVLLAAVGTAWFLASGQPSSWQALASHRGEAAAWVSAHPASALLLFVLAYVVAATFCLPGASVLTMAGGRLFGTWRGAAASILGATAGTVMLFVVVRYWMAGWFNHRLGGWLGPVRAGQDCDGFNYVLALRLIPAFPSWLVNVAPFALATAIGIVPGSLVFASIGAAVGVEAVLAREWRLTTIANSTSW